jgi:UDPglucose--hexose-1-phosphate uridylyltransferase
MLGNLSRGRWQKGAGIEVKTTITTLSDGRELIYFDEDGRAARTATDLRDLPAVEHTSELRYDQLSRSWVTIAAHRQDRIYLPAEDACPFDPTTPANQSEIPDSQYDVVVFENRFPSFWGEGPPAPADGTSETSFLPAAGRCEVICFTDDHNSSFAALPPSRVRLVVDAWVDRTVALLARGGVEQVYCFENRGAEIGVTERHPHGQIYGYPYITPRTTRVLEALRQHERAHSSNLFDDILANEKDDTTRVVVKGEHWTAFVPRAAKWPFEVHLYPERRVPNLAQLSEEAKDEFCTMYLDLLRRFDGLFGITMPYISGWHQAPKGHENGFAMHLELFSIRRTADKLKFLAGSESGMDAFISDVAPESAAARLRAV